ncbi:hypothetical protein ACFL3A_12010 [Pseudomonadota bacterium]
MDTKLLTSFTTFLLLITVLSACSTIAVHSDKEVTPSPYAGTNIAVTKTKRLWYAYDYYGQVMLSAPDVPFSFMADTLLYPIDVYRQNNVAGASK